MEDGEEKKYINLQLPDCTRESDVIEVGDKLYRITKLRVIGASGNGTLSFHKNVEKRPHS
jgi:hypothetical protein